MTGTTTPTPRILLGALLAALLALSLPVAAHAAFPGQNGPLVTVDDAVSVGSHPVTPRVGSWLTPHASADGTRIFAVHVPDPGGPVATAGVWSMRRDGTDRVQLTSSPEDRHPAPFPGGGRFVVANDGALWSVPVRPLDGTTPGAGRQLLFRDPSRRAANPEVSPDGTRVAFDATAANGSRDIWMLEVATLRLRRVTGTLGADAEPSWSPDGSRIAFATEGPNGHRDVFAVPVAGGPAQNLTSTLASDAREPAWSPDGTQVALVAGEGVLYAIVLATLERHSLFGPAESPDWPVAATVAPPAALPCTIAGKGLATVQGTPGRDVICGGPGPEQIDGGGGNDVIRGGGGDDRIAGGDGDDWIDGGDGQDRLDGGAAGDVLRGGAGADTVTYEHRAEDVVVQLPDEFGGAGGAHEGDRIADVEAAAGGAGDDILMGSGAIGRNLSGGDGDDVLMSRESDDRLDGGAGDDQLYAGGGHNALAGGDGADVLDAWDGDDEMLGGAGPDVLRARDGDDVLDGGGDDDRLDGGGGGDRLAGGDGDDTVTYEERTAAVAITPGDGLADDGEAGEGDLVGLDVERLTGGAGGDRLEASPKAERAVLDGRDGDDVLIGGFTADLLLGGAGADVLDASADDLPDRAQCGSDSEGDAPRRESEDVAIVDRADVADADCELVRARD